MKEFDVAYFAASVDDAETNQRFAESLGLNYPILSDPDKKVAEAYGVLSERGFARRWTFYINRDGTIEYIDKEVNPTDHGRAVVAKLTELGWR